MNRDERFSERAKKAIKNWNNFNSVYQERSKDGFHILSFYRANQRIYP
jgi:hypothetical protein